MPRYLVERTFHEDMLLPGPCQEPQLRQDFIANNQLEGVTWIHSYVAPDLRKSYCLYDAPILEALRRAAQRNQLPVDRIIAVQILNPYFYSNQNSAAGEQARD